MNKDLPLVTIVSICYNHSAFVCENLDSILNQSYQNIELIIMDDCSPDNSVEVIEQWIAENNVQCTFIAHKINKGVCFTMNEAISLSKGKYISLIAADDVMEFDKTSLQVELLEKSDERVALCVSNFSEIDKEGKLLKERYFSKDFIFPKDAFTAMLTTKGVLIHSPTAMIKAAVFDEVGLYDERYIQEDLYMWLKVTEKFEVLYINDVLIKYRILETSLSKNEIYREKMIQDRIAVLASFVSEAKTSKNENLLSSVLINSGYLVDLYLKNKKYPEVLKQIEMQEIYFEKLSNKRLFLPLLEAEITNIYIKNRPLAKKLLSSILFREISFFKKYLIIFFPSSVLKIYRNLKSNA